MKGIPGLLFFCFFLFSPWAKAQRSTLRIHAFWGDQGIQPGSWQWNSKGDSLFIEQFAFYVSGIQFYTQGKPIEIEAPPMLIRLGEAPRSLIAIPLHSDSISFRIGIDSVLQTRGALGGDLDPVQGMYWTWQSGYIHMKLEARTSVLPGEAHRIQCHLGGYAAPFNTIQQLGFPLTKESCIAIQLDQFLGAPSEMPHKVMSPSPAAVQLSRRFAQSIHTKP